MSGEDVPEWWATEATKKRNVPLTVAAVTLFGAGAFGAYLMFGRGADAPAPPVVAAASGPSAVVDPATLEPITMHAPLPTADDIFTSRFLRFTIALDGAAKQGGVATDAGADGGAVLATPELAEAEAALRGDDVREALGPRGAGAVGDLMTAAKAAAAAPAGDAASVEAFEMATARLDNALVAAGLPYFVDASVVLDPEKGSRMLLLYEFGIKATGLWASGDSRVRAVRLRRLDRLNWSHTLLGFVNPYRTYAVVLLDQVDEQLVTNVAPALAPDAPMPLLASEAESDASPVPLPRETAAIAARAGVAVRAELGAVLDKDAASARELGEALQARRALFDKWNGRLRGRGTLKSPPRLEVDVDALAREVGTALPAAEVEQLRALEKRLDAPGVRKAWASLRDTFLATVERHEVQHRLDQIIKISPPHALDALIPPGQGKSADDVREHVSAELSAYLAQIARDEQMARTSFTMLLRFVADPRVRGTAESYAAIIATEQLAAELGVEGVAPIVHDRDVDDAHVDRAHREITAVTPEKLREAAGKVWARLYGRPLAPLLKLPL
ncbi:MAG: hypothetical protein JWP97_2188 [Labilithrix sp.]|nr:hypothetical protein [Labilithrix sp.]